MKGKYDFDDEYWGDISAEGTNNEVIRIFTEHN
jgi:hypothetical protein